MPLEKLSRAEIAQSANLSRSTVSDVVGELLPTGLITEVVGRHVPYAAQAEAWAAGHPAEVREDERDFLQECHEAECCARRES